MKTKNPILKFLFFGLNSLWLAACSSTPKATHQPWSAGEAKPWLQRYCSQSKEAVSGEVIVRASTREFKGQMPGSVRVESNGDFVLEVTQLLGGTVARISSFDQKIQLEIPGKPKLNRSGLDQYLGVPIAILSQMVRGDLPCPPQSEWGRAETQGSELNVPLRHQSWRYSRAGPEMNSLPVQIRIEPEKIDFTIEEWEQEKGFARKVKLVSPQGSLRWSWRSR